MSIVDNAIEITHVTFSYGPNTALRDINLTVREGESLGIVGPNGGGKTTLLKLILGLLVPKEGRIAIFGKPPARITKEIGYVPQYAGFDRTFPITASEVVLMGRLGLGKLFPSYSKADRQVVRETMEDVGVWSLTNRRLGSLSEGQQQRVLLARALATRPRLLILDEPTASVDKVAEKEIARLLRELRRHITIVMVSHDLELLDECVDRLVYVNGQLEAHTPTYYGG